MRSLTELQLDMAEALRHPRALPDDAFWAQFAAENLCGNERLSPVEQLEIYREQFWLRHTGSLVEDFPGLCGILGQDDWDKLAVQYLREVVPSSFTLRDLGAQLPEVIGRASWLPHQALCHDMARLELAYIEAFDAADTAPLDPQRLAALPEEQLPLAKLVVAPCVRLLDIAYPVADLRRALRAEGNEPVAIPGPCAQNLVVYRLNRRLWDMPLSPPAYRLLTGLQQGATFGEAAERAAGSSPEAEVEVGELIGVWLREWTQKGLLCDVISP
jgi:hypothetical protein